MKEHIVTGAPNFLESCDVNLSMEFEPSPVQEVDKPLFRIGDLDNDDENEAQNDGAKYGEFASNSGNDFEKFASSTRTDFEKFASSTRTDFVEVETDFLSADPTNTMSQDTDTGYNTNSLQMSNPEVHVSHMPDSVRLGHPNMASTFHGSCPSLYEAKTGSFHTDLTHQFDEMPLISRSLEVTRSMDTSEGYNTGLEHTPSTSFTSNLLTKQCSPIRLPIIKERFPPDDDVLNISTPQRPDPPKSLASPSKRFASLTQDQIVQRAKQMLSHMDSGVSSDIAAPSGPTGGQTILRKTVRLKESLRSISHDSHITSGNPSIADSGQSRTKHILAMATPHRQQFQKLGIVPDNRDAENIPASE